MRKRVRWRSSVRSDFSDGGSAAEFLTDRPQVPLLKFADGDPAPPLVGADDGSAH